MKKRICKITALLLAASLFASGCGGKDGDGGRTEPETGALESTAAESLKNGSRVSMQLTDKVKLEAEAAPSRGLGRHGGDLSGAAKALRRKFPGPSTLSPDRRGTVGALLRGGQLRLRR